LTHSVNAATTTQQNDNPLGLVFQNKPMNTRMKVEN